MTWQNRTNWRIRIQYKSVYANIFNSLNGLALIKPAIYRQFIRTKPNRGHPMEGIGKYDFNNFSVLRACWDYTINDNRVVINFGQLSSGVALITPYQKECPCRCM